MFARLACILVIVLPQLLLSYAGVNLPLASQAVESVASRANSIQPCGEDCCCPPDDCPCVVEAPVEQRQPQPAFPMPVESTVVFYVTLRPALWACVQTQSDDSSQRVVADRRQPHHSYASLREFVGVWRT